MKYIGDINISTKKSLKRHILPKWCLVAQYEVREQNVENGGEGPADVVKGDTDVLEAEVVGSDHEDEHDGEGQNLLHGQRPDFQAVGEARYFIPKKKKYE